MYLIQEKVYQIIEDVSLMNVNRDESFEVDSLKLLQIASRLLYEHVEDVKEALVCVRHDALVYTRVVQGLLRLLCPQ